MEDITTTKIVEDSTDFLNELADNIEEKGNNDSKPIKATGKKGNIFVIIFGFLAVVFAYLVLIFKVIPVNQMFGLVSCLIPILLGIYYLTEKNKDKSNKFDNTTQIIGIVMVALGVIGAFFVRYSSN